MDADSLGQLDKTELIALVLAQAEQNAALAARVAALEARLATPPKTPSNSSLPPSKGQKANRPERPKKPRKGRPGVTRKLAETPDVVRDIGPGRCRRCDIQAVPGAQPDIHAYDFIDLPPIKPIVTRINLHRGVCPCCGKRVSAAPPADMAPGTPFGPGITALVVYLHIKHMVSFNRLQEFLKGVCGLDISEGAINNMLGRVGKPFAAEAERIATVVRNAAVITSDETSAPQAHEAAVPPLALRAGGPRHGQDVVAMGIRLGRRRLPQDRRHARRQSRHRVSCRRQTRGLGQRPLQCPTRPRRRASGLPRPPAARHPVCPLSKTAPPMAMPATGFSPSLANGCCSRRSRSATAATP